MTLALCAGGTLPRDAPTADAPPKPNGLALTTRALTISEVKGATLIKLSSLSAPESVPWTASENLACQGKPNGKGCWLPESGFLSLDPHTRTIPKKHEKGELGPQLGYKCANPLPE